MQGELFRKMKRHIGFDEADAAILAELQAPLKPHLPGIVEKFYEPIDDNPELLALFDGSSEQRERLRRSLLRWLEELFSGCYDTHYFRQRCEIGHRHVRIGLPQHYVSMAMNVVRVALLDALDHAKPTKRAAHRAVHKILDLELAILNETYCEDYVRRIQETEHEQYEQKLSESEHLATVGQLAASLAHEIKNPLAGISGAIQILGSGLASDHPHKEIITEALRQIDRLDAAVKDLLVYARPKPPAKTRQRLDAIVERVLILLREEPAFRNINLHCEGLNGDHMVVADEIQLQQVLTNLLLNAAHASEDDGDVTCRIKSVESRVRILVEDHGCGMPPEVLNRVFEPFYTTKARGTGLGLPICKRIVESHGGTIDIQSFVGRGTRVTVDIPTG